MISADALGDAFAFLDCEAVERCEMVSRACRNVCRARFANFPFRRVDRVEIRFEEKHFKACRMERAATTVSNGDASAASKLADSASDAFPAISSASTASESTASKSTTSKSTASKSTASWETRTLNEMFQALSNKRILARELRIVFNFPGSCELQEKKLDSQTAITPKIEKLFLVRLPHMWSNSENLVFHFNGENCEMSLDRYIQQMNLAMAIHLSRRPSAFSALRHRVTALHIRCDAKLAEFALNKSIFRPQIRKCQLLHTISANCFSANFLTELAGFLHVVPNGELIELRLRGNGDLDLLVDLLTKEFLKSDAPCPYFIYVENLAMCLHKEMENRKSTEVLSVETNASGLLIWRRPLSGATPPTLLDKIRRRDAADGGDDE